MVTRQKRISYLSFDYTLTKINYVEFMDEHFTNALGDNLMKSNIGGIKATWRGVCVEAKQF